MNRELIIHHANKIIGSFELTPEDEAYYAKLWAYFRGEPGELDPNKGLLITGTKGVGKTLSMKIFKSILIGSDRVFGIVACRHLSREILEEKNLKTISEYGRDSFVRNQHGFLEREKPITWCFDDLGAEESIISLYGNKTNAMTEILIDRYEHFIDYGMKTFVTSNLSPDSLEKNYGDRARDRFREMFNLITIEGESKRK